MKITTGRVISLAARLVAAAGTIALAGTLLAQTPNIQRTVVAKGDVSVPGREALVASVEIPPGGFAGWHTHPGDEMSYVMEGEFVLLIAGQPPKQYKPGEGFVIPAGTVHSAKNPGTTVTRIVGVYYNEKGKPLAIPAPTPAGQ
jgi:quercetin dioxygenase-like cupin family protein